MKKPFVVVQCNKKETEDAHIIKLQRKSVVEDKFFGAKEKNETLYIKAVKALSKDTEIPAEHIENNFVIREHKMMNPDTGEEFMGKWLHLK